jgi:hypothetical protein
MRLPNLQQIVKVELPCLVCHLGGPVDKKTLGFPLPI